MIASLVRVTMRRHQIFFHPGGLPVVNHPRGFHRNIREWAFVVSRDSMSTMLENLALGTTVQSASCELPILMRGSSHLALPWETLTLIY
jgi:hypothetical protein